MAEEIKEYITYDITPTNFMCSVKEEFLDNKVLVSKININNCSTEFVHYVKNDKIEQCKVEFPALSNIKKEFTSKETSCRTNDNKPNDKLNYKTEKVGITNDNVKIEVEISTVHDIKNEFGKGLLFCEDCRTCYEDYCIKCGMLVHILNRNTSCNIASEDVPKNILEIRELLGKTGMYVLKYIPQSVIFGPFTGLSSSECIWKLKGGKFVANEEMSEPYSWMQYINPARNVAEQNLIAFHHENKLYYRSIRQIAEGEELLVYFGEEYVNSLNEDDETDFVLTEGTTGDIYACTLCCLGFSSRVYLVRHKSICPNNVKNTFSTAELTQCQFCKIYLDEKEHLEYHVAYCQEIHGRKWIPLTRADKPAEENKRRARPRRMYECERCNYKSAYNGDLKNHANKHRPVKQYKCEICRRRFTTKESFRLHVGRAHLGLDRVEARKRTTSDYSRKAQRTAQRFESSRCEFRAANGARLKIHVKTKHRNEFKFKCASCEYRTTKRVHLEAHTKSKHLKEFDYKCEMCDCKTNKKSYLETHIKTKHRDEFDHRCELCHYKTNSKLELGKHVKTKHLDVFDHRCDSCDYKTNNKWHLKRHVKVKHRKEFDYECETCDYRTNKRATLEQHTKTKHLRKFDYKCDICDYESNQRTNLEKHRKTKHLDKFDYNCEICDYRTNGKNNLEMHTKTKHLQVFDYSCDLCGYKINNKSNLDRHVKTKHLDEFDYKCETCDYRTNGRSNMEVHVKTKHLKEFKYKCATCDYATNKKTCLEVHVKTKHLKEFDYKCEICDDYKTNDARSLSNHVKTKHLNLFDYECGACEYKTRLKSDLEKHVKSRHLKQFAYGCELCDYKTNQKAKLKRHAKSKQHLGALTDDGKDGKYLKQD